MKVRDLVAKLQGMDQDLEVYMAEEDGYPIVPYFVTKYYGHFLVIEEVVHFKSQRPDDEGAAPIVLIEGYNNP